MKHTMRTLCVFLFVGILGTACSQKNETFMPPEVYALKAIERDLTNLGYEVSGPETTGNIQTSAATAQKYTCDDEVKQKMKDYIAEADGYLAATESAYSPTIRDKATQMLVDLYYMNKDSQECFSEEGEYHAARERFFEFRYNLKNLKISVPEDQLPEELREEAPANFLPEETDEERFARKQEAREEARNNAKPETVSKLDSSKANLNNQTELPKVDRKVEKVDEVVVPKRETPVDVMDSSDADLGGSAELPKTEKKIEKVKEVVVPRRKDGVDTVESSKADIEDSSELGNISSEVKTVDAPAVLSPDASLEEYITFKLNHGGLNQEERESFESTLSGIYIFRSEIRERMQVVHDHLSAVHLASSNPEAQRPSGDEVPLRKVFLSKVPESVADRFSSCPIQIDNLITSRKDESTVLKTAMVENKNIVFIPTSLQSRRPKVENMGTFFKVLESGDSHIFSCDIIALDGDNEADRLVYKVPFQKSFGKITARTKYSENSPNVELSSLVVDSLDKKAMQDYIGDGHELFFIFKFRQMTEINFSSGIKTMPTDTQSEVPPLLGVNSSFPKGESDERFRCLPGKMMAFGLDTILTSAIFSSFPYLDRKVEVTAATSKPGGVVMFKTDLRDKPSRPRGGWENGKSPVVRKRFILNCLKDPGFVY